MTQARKWNEGDIIKIKKRRCRPFTQPYYKIGSMWKIAEVGDGYLRVYNKKTTTQTTKLTHSLFDIEKVREYELRKAKRKAEVEYMDASFKTRQISRNDNIISAINPCIIECLIFFYADKARWEAIQYALPFQKISRKIRDIHKIFAQRQNAILYNQFENIEHTIQLWRKGECTFEDFKLFNSAYIVVGKRFPHYRHPAVLAWAVVGLIAIRTYKMIFDDITELLAERMPEIERLKPLDMIVKDLQEQLNAYLPEPIDIYTDELTLSARVLYKQVHQFGEELADVTIEV